MPEFNAPLPFDRWVAEHRRGEASIEWAERLAEVLQAVQLTGKPGSITIKLDMVAKGRTIVVVDSVTCKIPEPDREMSTYFLDHTLSLTKHDPGQYRADFSGPEARVVDGSYDPRRETGDDE